MHQLGKPDAGRIQSIVGKEWRMLRRILGEMLYTTGPISVLASIRRWGPGGGGECMASGGGGVKHVGYKLPGQRRPCVPGVPGVYKVNRTRFPGL